MMSSRAVLVVIAGMFILPLVLAWLMFSGLIEFRPAATRNLGLLVEPPVPVSWNAVRVEGADGPSTDDFAGHWLVLYAVPRPCDESCIKAVAGLRQVYKAAGRDQSRIRLALLHRLEEPGPLRDVYAGFYLLENPGGELWDTLEAISRQRNASAGGPGSSYLVDPLGNIMMVYPAGSDPNDLRMDLKRLLRNL
jgi:cytochrome oxidase Cu insertion factor (SCO1/SenC/PrrC family)